MLDTLKTYLKNEEYRISLLNGKVHIMNYQSIIDITETEAFIKINNKIVKIYGNSFKLLKLDKKELLISGLVKRVEVNE